MKKDKLYSNLHFSSDYSVEDWNEMVKMLFGKYFVSDALLDKNREILRIEVINYIKFTNKPEFVKLFDWIFSLFTYCINNDKNASIKALSDSFHEVSNTDMRWMTNFMIQADSSDFSDRDKISYYFKFFDEVLEGCFKVRFKLLARFASFKANGVFVDNSNFDFGKLINDFPIQFHSDAHLLLKDPVNSISTNQWRNIAAHKSFVINKNDVVVRYGKSIPYSVSLSISDFYKTFQWVLDIYGVIRFAQVLISLNYMSDIVSELGNTDKVHVRLESSLLHLIHNMQVVGFEFIATEEQGETFCVIVKSKIEHDLISSLIHASQCLVPLSCSIYDDVFVRDSFQNAKINVIDRETGKTVSASISIEVALKRAYGNVTVEEYLDKVDFGGYLHKKL